MSTTTHTPTDVLVARLVERSRFEVLPLDGIEEHVLEHLPRDLKLTVTASPTKGLEATFDLVERLTGHGYTTVPHVSARLVASREHLRELLDRSRGLGLSDVFIVAGDAQEAAGPYEGAAALLEAMAELGHPFEEIGITGYPESHPFIDDATTIEAMFAKERFATYIASQVCFDPRVTVAWIESVWARGTRLPIYVGVPGAVSRAKLLRVSTRIGIGQSMRFLRKNGSFASRFLHGGFSPDPLVEGLGPLLDDPDGKVAGLHVFTFNDVSDTERWRQGRIRRGEAPERG
ncbi:MAG: methylenetetrahydrofolate reductase [Gaiella sp.]